MPPVFVHQDQQLYCEAVALAGIAHEVGTPVWVYSRSRIAGNYREVEAAFARFDAEIHYSLKANANLSILRDLVALGAGADVVSGGEVFRALKAGFLPEQIVFAGVGKTPAELDYALQTGVGWFNVESAQELALLDRLVAAVGVVPRVALRLNPDVHAETHRHMATGHATAKFGIDLPSARELAAGWAGRFAHLRLAGVHVHIGSQLATPAPTVGAVERALAFIDSINGEHEIEAINIGGGMPIVYQAGEQPAGVQQFAGALAPLLSDSGLRVMLEPGRRIVGDAGVLLVEVQYVKDRAGTHFVIVDGGMGDLLRPALYGAKHRVWPVAEPAPGEPVSVQLAGPICESADFLARDVSMVLPAPGDLLAVMDAGAYGAVMSTTYNARPLAPEVLVDGETFRVVRKRQTRDDLIRLEL